MQVSSGHGAKPLPLQYCLWPEVGPCILACSKLHAVGETATYVEYLNVYGDELEMLLSITDGFDISGSCQD